MDGLVAIYEAGDEDARMADASNRVEWERTLDLLDRWLPPAPARVLDIGGGPGRYAQRLQDSGYLVTLLDPVPKHVEQARPEVCAHLLRILEHGQDTEGSTFHQVSYNHDPEEFREEVAMAGLADVIVVGVEGPLGTEARVDPSLADAAIAAARIAETRAPHFSLHLLARGVKGVGR